LEKDFGLGAASVYLAPCQPSFLPVQGDLEHPPLQPGRLGLAIFNASLHYAHDLEETVRRAAEILQENGWMVIIDTPITRQTDLENDRRSLGQPRRTLGCRELEEALAAAGLAIRWISIGRGPRWWIFQAKKWFKREPRFAFPMIVAHRSR
jgi:hypothetical protein